MLYLVATPIGNLQDISLRALEVLKSVDLIASEDTRKTGFLLKHFEIHKPQVSFHAYNEQRTVGKLIMLLEEGQNIALVTNAGTPGISDPGYLLVKAAADRGLEITGVPGAAAVILAATLSGLPLHSFTFRGFPPHKPGARRNFLAADVESPHTLVYYESPYRLKAFLADALDVFGDRQASISNDLTKLFESTRRGSLLQLNQAFADENIRGEYTVVIAGKSDQ
ncbi:MAG: 16S rRNA (cytidine(1402)-2'-O)-methyltransferase [Anaerolineaceae bacterium]|nr:16S rRNA (cytidine(1402)-2'-O)-methyltransferase [Anaerolineaceae bacterium]MBN2678140.1 16S rRNA (cytidine(1402)-2'-O)-methyltransferase [Anaerolineaceae bacterium]